MRTIIISLWIVVNLVACSSGDAPKAVYHHAEKGVNTAAISRDGRFALVASTHHEAGLWDLAQHKLRYTWHLGDSKNLNLNVVDFSADSRYALTTEKHQLAVWHVESGENRAFIAMDQQREILCAALSRRGHQVLLGFRDGSAELVDVETGQTIKQFRHQGAINQVALSANGKFALTGGDDKYARLWSTDSGKLIQAWKHNAPINMVSLSPDAKFALTASQHAVPTVWDTSNGKRYLSLSLAPQTVTAASFASNEYLILGLLPQRIELWHLGKKSRKQQWRIARQNIWRPTATVVLAVQADLNKGIVRSEDSRGIGSVWQIN